MTENWYTGFVVRFFLVFLSRIIIENTATGMLATRIYGDHSSSISLTMFCTLKFSILTNVEINVPSILHYVNLTQISIRCGTKHNIIVGERKHLSLIHI